MTNRLSLKPGQPEPWIRPASRRASVSNVWLYCIDCKDRYFESGQQHSHIPYRDKASQLITKPVGRPRATGHGSQPADSLEPECEPDVPDSPRDRENKDDAPVRVELGDPLATAECDDEDEEEFVPDLPPERLFPTMAEYRAKWDRLPAQHSEAVPGEFLRDNLVPTPFFLCFGRTAHTCYSSNSSGESHRRV